jgi:RNA polymerase sigma factor (TIGR02999 family)
LRFITPPGRRRWKTTALGPAQLSLLQEPAEQARQQALNHLEGRPIMKGREQEIEWHLVVKAKIPRELVQGRHSFFGMLPHTAKLHAVGLRSVVVFNRLTWGSDAAAAGGFQVSTAALEGCLSQRPPNTVSHLLANLQAGDDEALSAVFPLVYNELRKVAHRYLRNERPDHTLQSTALVHEAYLRLVKQGANEFKNREHFVAICAQLMRQILVEYARSRNAAKRDGGFRISLSGDVAGKVPSLDVIALDDALNELAKLDAQQSRIVELRFFGGLSIEETSNVLNLSPTTVKRHWATARLWLHHQMSNA